MAHRVVKKLTSKHVHVSGLNKMNVKLAVQVLSKSVGSALCYLTALKYLPSSASDTADFCTKIDHLFDSLNSRVLMHRTKALLSAASSSSKHLEEWRSSLEFIKTIQFQTNGNKIQFPSITGWQVTLFAFLLLVPELFEKVKFVLLSRFNQDALENYFSQVRRKGDSNDHPTPVDFLQRTRMLLAERMFVMCGNANCEPDDDIILESTQIIPLTDEDCLELVIDESTTIMDCPEAQENWDDLELNSAAYVAGNISKKSLQKINCELCRANTQQHSNFH
ncbi:hypothetical protein AVEN_146477-1 [Araneus ventricosus]|uniref:Transposable element P transposase n=1 Tax=Araneus ventricosus TaxID=182803 RepID=A0A4Y2WFP4_ARAVE|nr:hypothetical protein AVEN_146477-1 [Araneus ventricosus]